MRLEDRDNPFRIFTGWLLLGTAAGFLLALVVTFQEYRRFSEWVGAALRQESSVENADIQENGMEETKIREMRSMEQTFAAALKNCGPSDRAAGQEWLLEYGYRPWGRLGEHTAVLSALCVLMAEGIGWSLFLIQKKRQKKQEQRIEGLTQYLLAAERGEAAALCRREDAFSHLEDAVYKAVMELRSTKEEAVHSHEVLSQRIADIAHQLKTPITSMSLMTELLEEGQTEEGKECLLRLSAQIRRLQNLVQALLSLAKLESHTIRFEREVVDAEGLIEGALEPLLELFQNKQIRLDASGETVYIQADRQWTEEAVLNLLKNCAEHTPAGGQIRVRWQENPLYTEIRFTDGGKGFHKKDLPHLFERFYRGEGAQKDSAGIGLALAKLIAEQQNGQLYAENTLDGHAGFILRFYR